MSEENTLSVTADDTANFIKFAKNRAKRLRSFLKDCGHQISHSESLEATARSEGYRDWNTYSAVFKTAGSEISNPVQIRLQYPFHVGDTIRGEYRGARFQGILLGLEETITTGVWRVKIHFDKPAKIPTVPTLNHTRQRINCMLNIEGVSVNLKGKPDGHLTLDMP